MLSRKNRANLTRKAIIDVLKRSKKPLPSTKVTNRVGEIALTGGWRPTQISGALSSLWKEGKIVRTDRPGYERTFLYAIPTPKPSPPKTGEETVKWDAGWAVKQGTLSNCLDRLEAASVALADLIEEAIGVLK